MIRAFQARNPGSNPGGRTISFFIRVDKRVPEVEVRHYHPVLSLGIH
jgi:hypothetical protein